jgi:ABC-type branched-subunit amino acid transport system substrate-binding protein
MSDQPKPAAERSYQIGNVGSGARVAQGENISWVEGVANSPGGEPLAQQFKALLERIAEDKSLDEDARALAQDKTKAIAEGLAKAQEEPGALRRALLDAKSWFDITATWVGKALVAILKSEPGQKALGAVSEGVTKAAIESFLVM